MEKHKASLGLLLGKNIAEHRKKLGWTQAELAEKLGADVVTISRFERGSHLPSLMRCESIAEALNTSLVELFTQSSRLPGDQALYLQTLLSDISDENRIFVMEMVQALCKHLQSQQ